MQVLIEEGGAFKVAKIMSEAASSLQVEFLSGKRSKIKANHVLLRFENVVPDLLDKAKAMAETFDIDFMWECCGEDEFTFGEFASDYFGHDPSVLESTAIAMRLHSAPIYFNRKGKGKYKAATEEVLKAALAGLEKKRIIQEQIAAYAEALSAFSLPEGIAKRLDMLLYAPDKNAIEYKAVDQAATKLHLSHLKLLEKAGAIPSTHDYHLGAFLREYFPDGEAFPDTDFVTEWPDLPVADVNAFSIDDSTTTEIDDAFSFAKQDDGLTKVGIHIAAPALGVWPDTPLDQEVLKRMSTVYMPGHKIMMLPEQVGQVFSLDEGQTRPALSLYLYVNDDYEIIQRDTKLELISIKDNLRHDDFEPYFNEETLEEDSGHAYWQPCLFLFRLAETLEKGRGKHDPNRPPQIDYSFYVNDGKVNIVGRRRGAPMDKLVAELMIEANQHWGGLLAKHSVPGLYRIKNGGKVFMGTEAEQHEGLGVKQYAWSTSPLRRAVDLINQRQIIAVVNNAEPDYTTSQNQLMPIAKQFELTYTAYADFQTRMERYWCCQYLVQEQLETIEAIVWRENLVNLEGMHFIIKVPNLPELAAGTRVRVKIGKVDLLMIELECRYEATL